MTPELFALVEQAYVLFDGPTPTDVGVCTGCCMLPADAKRLLSLPVREISEELMAQWMDAATDRDFPPAIWLHLLPRILEFLVNGDDPTFVGPEVTLRRGRAIVMSGPQRDLVNAFQQAFLAHIASEKPDDLDWVLCLLTNGGWSVADLSRQLLALPDDVVVRAMHHQFVTGYRVPPGSAFWEEPERTQIQAFFESHALYDRMLALGVEDGPQSEQAAEVVDLIFLTDD